MKNVNITILIKRKLIVVNCEKNAITDTHFGGMSRLIHVLYFIATFICIILQLRNYSHGIHLGVFSYLSDVNYKSLTTYVFNDKQQKKNR